MAETLEIPTGGFISDWNKVYPQPAWCAVAVFRLGFSQEYHHPESPLGDACPSFTGLLMSNRRQSKWKYRSYLILATILENASVWNTQTCEFVATRTPEASQISSCYVYFRFFVIAADRENGTFSTINISKTIAGATGGDRSYWKSNK